MRQMRARGAELSRRASLAAFFVLGAGRRAWLLSANMLERGDNHHRKISWPKK